MVPDFLQDCMQWVLDGCSTQNWVWLPDMCGQSQQAKQQMRPASPGWLGLTGHQQEPSRCVSLKRDERKWENFLRAAGGVQKLRKAEWRQQHDWVSLWRPKRVTWGNGFKKLSSWKPAGADALHTPGRKGGRDRLKEVSESHHHRACLGSWPLQLMPSNLSTQEEGTSLPQDNSGVVLGGGGRGHRRTCQLHLGCGRVKCDNQDPQEATLPDVPETVPNTASG